MTYIILLAAIFCFFYTAAKIVRRGVPRNK